MPRYAWRSTNLPGRSRPCHDFLLAVPATISAMRLEIPIHGTRPAQRSAAEFLAGRGEYWLSPTFSYVASSRSTAIQGRNGIWYLRRVRGWCPACCRQQAFSASDHQVGGPLMAPFTPSRTDQILNTDQSGWAGEVLLPDALPWNWLVVMPMFGWRSTAAWNRVDATPANASTGNNAPYVIWKRSLLVSGLHQTS